MSTEGRGTFSHSQQVELWYGILLFMHFPKPGNNKRNRSTRNIYTHTHSKTLALFLLGDTPPALLTTVRAAESTSSLFSGGTVDAQRKAFIQGRCTDFYTKKSECLPAAIEIAWLPTLSEWCWESSLQKFQFSSLVSLVGLRCYCSHSLELKMKMIIQKYSFFFLQTAHRTILSEQPMQPLTAGA